MAIKAVIFDWAGTMIDFGSIAPVRALDMVFQERGIQIGDELIRKFMGAAKRDHVSALLGETEVARQWQDRFANPPAESDIGTIMDALEPAMRKAAAQHTALIPGAAACVDNLRKSGIKIGSTTGYSRSMMTDILSSADQQGYRPDALVCAGETPAGRPAPFMIWKCLSELGVWETGQTIKVDDAPVGIAAGRHAGTWTVGVAASGNLVGLSQSEFDALSPQERHTRLDSAASAFAAENPDFIISTVADLGPIIEMIGKRLECGKRPGTDGMQVLL